MSRSTSILARGSGSHRSGSGHSLALRHIRKAHCCPRSKRHAFGVSAPPATTQPFATSKIGNDHPNVMKVTSKTGNGFPKRGKGTSKTRSGFLNVTKVTSKTGSGFYNVTKATSKIRSGFPNVTKVTSKIGSGFPTSRKVTSQIGSPKIDGQEADRGS